MTAMRPVANPASVEPTATGFNDLQQHLLRDLAASGVPLSDDVRRDLRMMAGDDPDGEDSDGGDAGAVDRRETAARRSRAEQSRINGAKSRGPTSALGRQIVAMNSIVHGMRSRPGMLPDENCQDFDTHVAGVMAELAPTTELQGRLARRVAELSWRLQRVPRIEADLLVRISIGDGQPLVGANGVDDLLARGIGTEKDAALLRIQRYATTIERSMRNCLRELRDLQFVGATRAEVAAALATTGARGHDTRAAGAAGQAPPKSPMPKSPATVQDSPVRDAPARNAPPGVQAPPPVQPSPGVAATAPTSTPHDGLRFSGSFGAAATMAMPTTAISAEAAAAAVSGSLGRKSRPAGKAPPAIAGINEILPNLGQGCAAGAV